jgi:hypothetical protein
MTSKKKQGNFQMTPEVPLSFYLRDYPLPVSRFFPFGGPLKGSLQRIKGIAVLLPESFPHVMTGVAPSAPHRVKANALWSLSHNPQSLTIPNNCKRVNSQKIGDVREILTF